MRNPRINDQTVTYIYYFVCVAWINEIWKQALHFQSLFSFPSGRDHMSYNQPAAHNPDIWCFHCSAHASAWWFHCSACPLPPFFFLLPVRARGFASSIISDCDKLQRERRPKRPDSKSHSKTTASHWQRAIFTVGVNRQFGGCRVHCSAQSLENSP